MRLTLKALQQIKNSQTRMKIALALKVGDPWIVKCIKANKEDGFLTKASALKVIKQETGLKEDEILTEEVLSEVEQTK